MSSGSNHRDERANDAIFRQLQAHKEEIESAFGARLTWHVARGRSRAIQFVASHYGFDDRDRWPQIQAALINAMVQLEAACRPFLHERPPVESANAAVAVPAARQVAAPATVFARRGPDMICVANLRAGIADFKRRWPGESDFNARLYTELRTLRDTGRLTWERLVAELNVWRALRTSQPGRDTTWYLGHGREPFGRMLKIVERIRGAHGGQDPDLAETEPQELVELFNTALAIKGAGSPTFPSKLCHFLIPSAFPVADQAMLGIETVDAYWPYWRACSDGWRASSEKETLVHELRTAMSTPPTGTYPWASKITELCYAGAACPSVTAAGLDEALSVPTASNYPRAKPSGALARSRPGRRGRSA